MTSLMPNLIFDIDIPSNFHQTTEKCNQDKAPSTGEELMKMKEMLEEARREKETVSKELEIQVLIFGYTVGHVKACLEK